MNAMPFDPKQEVQWLAQALLPASLQVFTRSAIQHQILLRSAINRKRGNKTTAQDIAARLNIDIPDDILLDLPSWLQDVAAETIEDILREDYWQSIPETTAGDIQETLEAGIAEGRSIAAIAKSISKAAPEYNRIRATRVARTETTAMRNAGHVAAMDSVQKETGIQIEKEWLSVLGNTTRPHHASADGQVSKDGMFTVGGESTPYPAHAKMSAGNRINCQCTVISSFVMDELTKADPDLDPEVDDDGAVETPEARYKRLDNQNVMEVVNSDPKLEAKRLSVTQSLKDTRAKLEKKLGNIAEQHAKVKKQRSLLMAHRYVLWDERQHLMHQPNSKEKTDRLEEIAAELEMMRSEFKKLEAKDEKLAGFEDTTRTQARSEALRRLNVNDSTMNTSAHVLTKRGTISTPRTRDHMVHVIRGKAQEADTFVSSLISGRQTDDEKKEFAHKQLRYRVHNLYDHDRGLRAHYQPQRRSFDNTWKKRRDGVNIVPEDDTGVFIHELGHHLEFVLPGLERRANEFRNMRIARAGTKDIKMNEATGDRRYRDNEVGNEDSFQKSFGARNGETKPRVSSKFYAGKSYKGGYTEIMSMGLEELYHDPIGFAERDPEYFKFVVGALDGSIK